MISRPRICGRYPESTKVGIYLPLLMRLTKGLSFSHRYRSHRFSACNGLCTQFDESFTISLDEGVNLIGRERLTRSDGSPHRRIESRVP